MTILRNVDLKKTVSVSDVLTILDGLVADLDSRHALEGNEWNGSGYDPATPQEVLTYAKECASGARDALLGLIP